MSACISRHGEYSEHTPDADWTCTLCGDVDTAGLRDEVDRLRGALAEWRDGYARDTYDVLSDWLVDDLNALLDPTEGETDE